jgi:hypothetical protein
MGMEIRVGDKVRFLNDVGGGMVTAIVDIHMVKVMTEDGFEMPVLKRELILVPQEQNQPDQEQKQEKPEHATVSVAPQRKMPPRGDRSREASGIYLAWVRQPGSRVEGEVDLMLVNHTPHDVLYNILSEEAHEAKGFDYGSLAPGSTALIQEWPGNVNDLLLRGWVQVLYHPLENSRFPKPLSTEFRVKATRIFKDDSYRISPFFADPAIVSFLGFTGEEEQSAAKDPVRAEERSVSVIDQYVKGEKEAVIDLHLEKLIDNVKGVSAAEALQIQTNYFERCMAAAVTRELETVVFIHGVGNGILKSEIRRRLEKMMNVLYFDAPLSQYGVGATEVRIHY